MTNHEAAGSLYAATDRDATPPRVDATPPGQYGLELGRGSSGPLAPNPAYYPLFSEGKKVGPGDYASLGPRTGHPYRARREVSNHFVSMMHDAGCDSPSEEKKADIAS